MKRRTVLGMGLGAAATAALPANAQPSPRIHPPHPLTCVGMVVGAVVGRPVGAVVGRSVGAVVGA